jgi:hypothetical protein
MKVGSKTHLCYGSREGGERPFGRLVNLYVRQGLTGKWVKIGTMCSNCGDHWINGVSCEVPRPKSRKEAKS